MVLTLKPSLYGALTHTLTSVAALQIALIAVQLCPCSRARCHTGGCPGVVNREQQVILSVHASCMLAIPHSMHVKSPPLHNHGFRTKLRLYSIRGYSRGMAVLPVCILETAAAE